MSPFGLSPHGLFRLGSYYGAATQEQKEKYQSLKNPHREV